MISRLRRMSRGGWVACGIILGAIIAPGVALAAFSDVRIVGFGGAPVAQVTPANQLRVAEVEPARIRRFFANVGPAARCTSFNAPAGSSLMLRQVVIDVFQNPSPSSADRVDVYARKNCVGPIGGVTPTGTGTTTIPFEPGVPIRSGGGFSVFAGGDVIGNVYLLGYTMPASAVP